MMITPIMFLFFFLWAPSGLVIYWLVSNLLGIAQQYGTNKIIGAPVVKQVRPPAERRLKQAGSGRTEARAKQVTRHRRLCAGDRRLRERRHYGDGSDAGGGCHGDAGWHSRRRER